LNLKKKITLIIGLQISLIVSSFLVLVYLESEWLEMGQTINYAGLNRFLTIETHLQLHTSIYENDIIEKPESLLKLKENLLLIKDGGTKNGNFLKPLPIELHEEWTKTYESYLVFEKNILDILIAEQNDVNDIHMQVNQSGENLVENSNEFVEQIALFLENLHVLLIRLQLVLLSINTLVHLLFIFLIFRIFNKDAEEKLRLEKFAIIGKLGASIAHDLRNSLTVIKGAFDILKINSHDMDDVLKKKQYEKIDDSINKIKYLTKDILDFTRTQELNKEESSILDIIKKSINEVKIPNQIQIQLPKRDYNINIDKIKFQTVMSNLIQNSVDAIDQKGLIKIDLNETYDDIVVIVQDSGKGISRNDLANIFEPLYTTKITGTGLGLSSCKRIIEQHGGKIRVKINPTTFTISFPKIR